MTRSPGTLNSMTARRIPPIQCLLTFEALARLRSVTLTAEDIREGMVCVLSAYVVEPQFQGHFPAEPVFPGVMIIEAMAQTACVLVGVTLDLADKNMLVYFMGIEGAKFRRKVVPGDVMELDGGVLGRQRQRVVAYPG